MAERPKLLVVEDEPNLLMGIRDILELADYDVMTAGNGRDALEALKGVGSDLPDLIVSDIMMPYMDGLELLENVRKTERWVKIPFIFLTARGERSDVNRGKLMGVDDYLIKPFDADDLLVAVQAKIERIQEIDKQQEKAISGIKRNILTMLNHEFRTPLTVVVGFAEMLKESQQDLNAMSEDELLLFLRQINTGADRLRRLVENFITLVELDAGDAAKTYEWRRTEITDLDVIIQAAAEQFNVSESITNPIEVEIASPLPAIVGDREYLMTILRELLDNAVKFSNPGGPIQLIAEAADRLVYIHVRDQGRGIPPEHIDKIWDPFFQIERDQFEDQGAGGGLAIVDGLLKLHGGEREVLSRPGAGATFSIALPVATQ